jgi:hypothetical protein
MTPETAVEYVRACGCEKPVGMGIGVGWQATTEVRDANDHRVKALFHEYDYRKEGKIYKEDFLRMYKTASICKVERVWADLKAHGLGNDL